MKKAMEMADRIAGNGPLAVQGIIRCFRETLDMPYADAFKREMESACLFLAARMHGKAFLHIRNKKA